MIEQIFQMTQGNKGTIEYAAGTILKIPKGIQMNVKSLHDDNVELLS
ncbi:MAG: hypothetical protein VB085_02160 [Peptococcaceae bacterium]|nr:hypothetical protein [Peptococcaceae bacterium]